MKFAHISDVHIKNLTRHEQYREVFENLYLSLRQSKVDAIVVSGDIRHNKTNISPQYFHVARQFLYNLAEITTVHVIIGNHDCNLSNLSRLDSVTPVVSRLNGSTRNEIIVYRNTGLYTIKPGFEFFVYSLTDQKEINKEDLKPNQNARIRLFHGTTKGCHNKFGYKFQQADDYVNSFAEFCDYGFFGDIHTMQFLSNQKFAYCGSIIQQDYGEELQKGYLIWDIESKDKYDVKFIQLYNKYKFITVDVKEDLTHNIESEINEFTRLRFVFKSSTTSADIRKIVQKYKDIRLEVVFNKDDQVEKGNIAFEQGQLEQIYDRKFLLKKYFQKKQQVIDLQQLYKIDELVNEQLKDDYHDKKYRVSWRLNNIRFGNIFNYGPQNEFSFTELSGLNGVFGPNRSGKSSFLSILLVAIYGRRPKADDVKDIVRFKRENRFTDIIIDTSKGQYRIHRDFEYVQNPKRKNAKKFSSVRLSYRKSAQQEWAPENKVDKTETERYIQAIFGRYQTIIISAFARQRDIEQFIDVKQKQRVELLIKYFNLDIFNKLYNIANDKKKQIKSNVVALESLLDYEIDEVNSDKQMIENELQILFAKLKEVTDKQERLEAVIKGLYSKLYTIQENCLTIDQTVLNDKISEYNKTIETKLQQIKRKQEFLAASYPACGVKIEQMKQVIQKQQKLQRQLETIKIKAQHTIKQKSLQIQNYKGIEKKEMCYRCPMMKDFENNNKAIQESKRAILKIQENISNSQKKSNLLGRILRRYQLEKVFKRQIEYATDARESLQFKLHYKIKNQQRIKFNEELNKEIELKDIQSIAIDRQSQKIKSTIKDLQIKQAKLINKIQIYQNNQEKLKSNKVRLRILQKYCEAVNYQGIPKNIINYLLPKFEDKVNEIISQIDDFRIKFKLDNELKILIDDRNIETASGMQQLIFSFAFRMRLAKYQYADLFVIDQAFSHLDGQNRLKAGRICKTIPEYFTHVFLIEHLEVVKDFVDNVIEVRKVDGRSKIYV